MKCSSIMRRLVAQFGVPAWTRHNQRVFVSGNFSLAEGSPFAKWGVMKLLIDRDYKAGDTITIPATSVAPSTKLILPCDYEANTWVEV